MFDNQADAVAFALASRPRGLKCGDTVIYSNHRFEVVAIQQWAMKGAAHSVGLVWGGRCGHCDDDWHQLTETRVTALAEMCPDCDVVGATSETLDKVVTNILLAESGFETRMKTEDRSGRGAVRYGANERHVLEVIDEDYVGVENVSELAFVTHCASRLPPPSEDKRDQRVFLARRAVQSLLRRKNGPIALEHGKIIFCT